MKTTDALSSRNARCEDSQGLRMLPCGAGVVSWVGAGSARPAQGAPAGSSAPTWVCDPALNITKTRARGHKSFVPPLDKD